MIKKHLKEKFLNRIKTKTYGYLTKIFKIEFLYISLIWYLPAESSSQILLNEILATNANSVIDPDYYNFPDYIEIFNSGSSNVNLSDYYLSDNSDSLLLWKLPDATLYPKQYYILYCDKKNIGRHTSFGLDAEGENVYLTDKSGNAIDHIQFGMQFPDVSFGRDPNDMVRWYYCLKPTPGAANNITLASTESPRADYSIRAGIINSSVSLSLTGSGIKYTTNGAEPDLTSASYSQPVSVNKTMTVKTKTFQDSYLPGETYANTYFLNTHTFTLPVISLTFKSDYFYDNIIGIHVAGTNGTEGNCGSIANWNQDWERAAYLEYFDEEGNKQISQPIGVKVSGGCTRGREQKSLSLYARSKYGNNDFDYPVFKQKPDITSYKSLLLRNSGNDQDQTLLRDAFLQALVNKSMDIDFQSYQPAIVYFNSEYRGIMNLREKVDEDYFLSNYATGSDEVDFLEVVLRADADNCYNAIRGSAGDYKDLIAYISANSLKENENYQYIASKLDIQEYINYMTLQIYIANRDWPGNNIKFWRNKDNGKWRWIVFDLDYGFGFRLDENGYSHETFEYITELSGPDHPNPAWSTLLFRKLIENEGFKKQFLSTFITHIYSSFSTEWCNYVLDSLSGNIEYEITYNQIKYGRTKAQWLQFLNTIKQYAINRNTFMPGYVKTFFKLSSDTRNIIISDFDTDHGKIKINGAMIQMYPINISTYKELPLSITAVPEKGFRFVQWNYISDHTLYSKNIRISSDTSFNLAVKPIFEPVDEIEGIFINEIAAATSLFRDEFGEKSGFVELHNSTGEDKTFCSFFLSDKRNSLTRYAVPDSTMIPAGGFVTFYLDGEARQGEFHAMFRADPDGESLYLSQKVGDAVNILDSVNFTFLMENHSYGRYIDGTGNWQHMVHLTPGEPNDMEKLADEPEYHRYNEIFEIFPNPAQGRLQIRFNNQAGISDYYFADIVDLYGRIVLTKAWLNSNNAVIDLSFLSKGLYFIRIYNGNSVVYTNKLIITK